jgi:hypothetical protein
MAKEVILGRNLVLSLENKVVGCATNNSLTSEVSMQEAACKESGNFYDAVPDRFSASLDLEGLVIYDNPVDTTAMRSHNIADLHMNKTLLDWKFGTTTAGQKSWTGKGYITSYSETAPEEGNATYSVSIQVVGAYGPVTNA